MATRLFDFVQARAAADPQSTMLAAKESGAWRTYSSGEVWEKAQAMARGLMKITAPSTDALHDPERQEKVVLISPNRPEWIITDLAVQMTGAVLTPIYPTINPSELAYILREAHVHTVIIADADMARRFGETVVDAAVKHVFCFEDKVPHSRCWTDLLDAGADTSIALPTDRITGDTLATIIYTSGTTGTPKGVMLSHSNVVSNVHDSMPAFTFAIAGEKALSFLPLNHIFERMVSYIYLAAGLSIWYAESMETIGDNLREVKPMVFTTVPRLLEKVYERIVSKGEELTGVKRKLFFWALGLANRYDNVRSPGPLYDLQLKIADRIIFSKWRAALGGQVKAIVSGSAALQERLIRIFTAAGVIIMEGYGLTETSPVISVNRFESEDRRIGTIGPLIRGVEVRLGEDGEIITRGPNVMMGYYKQPELTAEVLRDGWFHTGDIGAWVEGRFLKITDRKKEIFKTSGGKYVAPQPVENKMRESPYIEQIMVVGAGQKFTGALIVPAWTLLRAALRNIGSKDADAPLEALVDSADARDLIRHQLDKYNAFFGHVEQVKKFALLPKEWTVDSGELTPSLKMRRKVIEQKFAAQIASLYS